MASTMVYDMSDPGVKKMVDGWADNTEYTGTVTIKTGAGPQRNVCEVTGFEPDEALEETEPLEQSEKKPRGGPKVRVEY